MSVAVVVDAVRTPFGARGGALSGWHPADLLAELLGALVRRTGLDPERIDDVVAGCAMPVGSQGFNVARNAVLAAGWPEAVPGGTVDRQAVSSLAAVVDAARAVAAGDCQAVVAAGVEVMSTTPRGATLVPGAVPFGPALIRRYHDAGGLVPAGPAAEALALALGLDRDDLDDVARRSLARWRAGPGVVPVASRVFDRDRGEVVRPGTTIGADELAARDPGLADARPVFVPGGSVTAANSAPIADGAAALLVVSEAVAAGLDVVPLAVVRSAAVTGADPLGLTGAWAATERVLERAGVGVVDVGRFEVGEPFAPVAVAFERAAGAGPDRVNPSGGGIAVGEPTGAVGARLVATLAHGLTGRFGVAAVGDLGLGAAVLLERS